MEEIKNVVAQVLSQIKKKNKSRQDVGILINKILNKNIKKHLKQWRIYKNTVIFYMDSPVWSYQTHLLKNKILQQITKYNLPIKEVKIKTYKG